MALKSVLDSLEGVDDALKDFYTEAEDGKFVLQVEGINAHPEVANLKSAYERVKADKQALSGERDALKEKVDGLPEDFDPKEWDKLKKGGKADPEDLVKLRQTLESERDDWKGKAEQAQEQLRKTVVERSLDEALAAQGVTNPAYLKAARALISPQIQLSEDGKAVVETDMGPMALADHVKRWTADEGKAFVTPPSGGGAKGNPGSTDSKSVTKDQWDSMSHRERRDFSVSGGTIVE